MNAKSAKNIRRMNRIMNLSPEDVQHQWIKRPDGTVFRQLSPRSGRAFYQMSKGKGFSRVHVKQ